jgi:YD repeat-containing protein
MSATVTFIAKIATGHLLRAVRYPDSTNSATTVAYIDSTSDADVVSHVYNAQFEEISRKDQAGNVIDNSYDLNGQLTDRTVSTLASGIDAAVRRIARAYDSLGRTETVAQHNATSGGSVVDQVKHVYDGWGNVTNFQQDKDSTVGGSV